MIDCICQSPYTIATHVDTVHECDRQTDGQTDGQTDRITITKTVQRRASHGNEACNRLAWQLVVAAITFKF